MLIVDTYNVLHITGVLPPHLAGPDVEQLAELVGLSRYRKGKTLLVCDGAPAGDAPPGDSAVRAWEKDSARLRIVYAGAGVEADDLIETLVHRFGGQRTITVVSSDRRLRRNSNTWKCKHLSGEEWLHQLAFDNEHGRHASRAIKRPRFATDLPLTPSVAELWMREMGVAEVVEEAAPVRQKPAAKSPEPKPEPEPKPAVRPPVSPEKPAVKQAVKPPARSVEARIDPLIGMDAADLDMERWLMLGPDPKPRAPRVMKPADRSKKKRK